MIEMDVREKLVELLHTAHNKVADVALEDDEKTYSDAVGMEADELIAHGVTVQEWISVKDRLPEGGAIVLCNTDYFVEVLQWDERADMWFDQYRSYRKNYVTHWMPLPQPPKGE